MLMRHRWQTPAEQARAHAEAPHGGHPEVRTYLVVAVILAVLTAIEVAATYIDALEDVLTPLLISLAAVKFAGVAGWFMHLRFDNALFTGFFAGGIALAFTVFIVVLTVFRVLFV